MLWDLNESKHFFSLEAGDVINALTFSPNRYWLCAATGQGIKIWDLESKSIVDELRPEFPVCIAFSRCYFTLFYFFIFYVTDVRLSHSTFISFLSLILLSTFNNRLWDLNLFHHNVFLWPGLLMDKLYSLVTLIISSEYGKLLGHK